MTYSADAIAILAAEHCPEDIAAALDAELTEIETSVEYLTFDHIQTCAFCLAGPWYCTGYWSIAAGLPVGVARGGQADG